MIRSMIFKNWNLVRLLRLIIGLGALVQGFWQGDFLILLAGAFLLFTALINIGCCGAGGCALPMNHLPAKPGEDSVAPKRDPEGSANH